MAENYLGRDEASVRIDVFGPPYVRPMERKSLVAETDVWIHCPYSGFPISEIKWSKEGEREINEAGRRGVKSPKNEKKRCFCLGCKKLT